MRCAARIGVSGRRGLLTPSLCLIAPQLLSSDLPDSAFDELQSLSKRAMIEQLPFFRVCADFPDLADR